MPHNYLYKLISVKMFTKVTKCGMFPVNYHFNVTLKICACALFLKIVLYLIT